MRANYVLMDIIVVKVLYLKTIKQIKGLKFRRGVFLSHLDYEV